MPTSADSPIESENALDRLRKVPVRIIVKLAEKRIELGQLLAIGPGAIVTFEKSCEDLLDLYVNNQLYCRGEAVKIGEKFGIKICEVGSTHQRLSAVLATP
jgi:flagellar motor switch protein FliN/FliY